MTSRIDPMVILECNIRDIQKNILKLNKIIYENSVSINCFLNNISEALEGIVSLLPELKK